METSSKPHIGRKIMRVRELRGMKQETLAEALGISQQSVSALERSAEVDDKRLNDVAEALGVSAEAIKNFSDEAVINYFNTFNESDFSNSNGAFGHNNACSFNPLDKMMELVEENRRLYERLLESEREKVGYLEKLVNK